MAITLPLPFRIAAGIVGTGIDLVRSLPEEIPAIPVTLVGNAMKLSIKVQQEIASLATRGDELLGGVIGGPEESPAWAKFDDDEPVQPVRPARPVRPVSKLRTAPPAEDQDVVVSTTPASPPAGEPGKPGPKTTPGGTPDPAASAGFGSMTAREPGTAHEARTAQTADDTPTLTTPEATSIPPTVTTAMDAAIDVADAVIEEALVAVDESPAADVLTPGDAVLNDAVLNDAVLNDAVLNDAVLNEVLNDAVLDEATLEAAIELEVMAEVTEALEDAAALDVIAEVTEALEDAVALEVAAEVTEALEDAVAQELSTEFSAALEDVLAAEAGPPSDPEDFTENPVVFGETEELTETLPVPPELLVEVAAATAVEDGEVESGEGESGEGESGESGPAALPDYDQMTLAQVRGHLRELSSDDVSALLRYEQDGDARPPFLTLLSNRLVTLDAQSQ